MKKSQRIGEPLSYKQLGQRNTKSLQRIRGIYKAWQKAPGYALRLEAANHVKVYVDTAGVLSSDKEKRKIFKEGFDDPEQKKKYWMSILKVKLITERV